MNDNRTFIIERANQRAGEVVENAIRAIREWAGVADLQVKLSDITRTLDANAAMWATLTDIAAQVDWPHTDGGEWRIGKMSRESWKAVLTAGFEQETRMAQGVDGGAVMLGARTSQFSRRKMGGFLEFAHAFGADKGVKFSERSRGDLAFYAREAA